MIETETERKKICKIIILINNVSLTYNNAILLSLSDNLISFTDSKTNQKITYNTQFLISCQEVSSI